VLPRRIAPFVFLALTLPAAAIIPIAPSAGAFFRLEVAVTVPHFLIILWLVICDAPIVIEAVRHRAAVQ
jgi:hypothetical protein